MLGINNRNENPKNILEIKGTITYAMLGSKRKQKPKVKNM